MLQLFKNNHFLTSLLLLPLSILLHFRIFLYDSPANLEGVGYLGKQIVNWFDPFSTFAQILGIILIFFQATLINRITVMHRLSSQITLIPGFLWVVLSATHNNLMGFSAQSVAILFLLIGINSLFKAYQKKNAEVNNFNTGFYLGISSLIYYPVTILLIFGITGLYSLRTIRPLEIKQYLIGWITPYFLLFCIAYVFDNLSNFIEAQWHSNWAFIDLSIDMGVESYPFWIFFTILFAICLLNYSVYFSKKIIYAQKKISVLITYFFFIAFALLFVQDPSLTYILLFLWPLSFFLSESLISIKNQMIAELFIWLIMLFCFFMQYQTIL